VYGRAGGHLRPTLLLLGLLGLLGGVDLKIYPEMLSDKCTRSHFTAVAQIQFIILMILAYSVVNQILGHFSFKRILKNFLSISGKLVHN